MASTYVNDLRLEEMATGDQSGSWGTTTNTNLELIGEALGYGTEGITTNADTHTTTVADGATDPGRAMYIEYTGTLDSACTITIAPNTLNRMHFIENGTSGSQNIIISQGSGANITIPPGDVKAVYLDGAGSGAAVVDAFASLNVVDLKVQDDLTVTDDATIGGTLGVTGIVTLTDDLIIGDGKTIGSASDVDAMTIASNGQVTFTQTLIGTALDISGDIDVDGTTNLDVVDIDGAVDMATTLAVAGNVDFNGDLDVDGTTNLDVVDIDGALTQDGGAVFNEASANVDFRVESDGNTHMLFVDADTNKIGIGTSSPSNNLEIFTDAGDEGLTIKATGDTSNAIISDANRSGAGAAINALTGKWNGTSVADILFLTGADTTNKDDGVITFRTSSADNLAERMRIDTQGRLLVGTTSKISGDQGNAGYLAVHGNTDASGAICEVKNTGNPASNRDFIRFFNTSDGEAGSIEHNGTSTVAYNTSSDYRLKENIKPLANGLQRLLQLKPVQFDWKEDKTSSEGFIAHEVQEIFSDAISGEKDGEQTQGMDYGRITPLLVKAIQEQQEQIEGLKQEIQNLKGE
tara:strand:+ start:506 stop:2239 length:1734 start_codon:yes stop_codon:yes gene_type:complete